MLFSTENLTENLDLEAEIPKNEKESTGEKVKDVFCERWELAKGALELLLLVLKNPLAKWVVNIVINIGNAVQYKFCGD